MGNGRICLKQKIKIKVWIEITIKWTSTIFWNNMEDPSIFLLIKIYNETLLSDQVLLGWLFILLLRALRKIFLLIKILMKRVLSYLGIHKIQHFFLFRQNWDKKISMNFLNHMHRRILFAFDQIYII